MESVVSNSLAQVYNNKSDDKELNNETTNQLEATPKDVWGPFYVMNAPFRAKISPIDAIGIPLMISGRVFGLDTKKGLPFAVVDIWHTSPEAVYDYQEADPTKIYPYREELNTHGRSTNYDYRARLVTDEGGRYEFETVKPVPYFDTDDSTWRCPHIHYYVQSHGYKPLVTQLYFHGEEKNDIDGHINEKTTITLKQITSTRSVNSNVNYLTGTFDLVLESCSD